jgi:hypothetical protein
LSCNEEEETFQKWKLLAMMQRTQKQDPLAEIIQSQQEEIKQYKWIESEKVGRDIGWECAAHEWSHRHFPEWKRHVWNRAVQDALRAEERGTSFPF